MKNLIYIYYIIYSKNKRSIDYYILTLASDKKEYYFIICNWDLEKVRVKPWLKKLFTKR